MTTIAVIAFFTMCCVVFAYASTRLPKWAYALIWAVWCTVWCIVGLLTHDSFAAAFNAVLASYWWRTFWRNKPPRMRDRVAKLIGAKARAAKAKLVAAMPKPSPVGKPAFAPTLGRAMFGIGLTPSPAFLVRVELEGTSQ